MTKSKWRLLLITSLITAAPMLYGASVYSRLPRIMATHWGLNNQPNGWMPRPLAVFGLPLLMVAFHLLSMGITYYSDHAKNSAALQGQRMERVVVWIFPAVSVVATTVTIRFNLGSSINMRFWALVLVAAILILIGNYLPTVPEVGFGHFGFHLPWRVRNQSGMRKTARIMGYFYVVSGVIILLSLFFSPTVSWILILLFIAANLVLMAISYSWTAR